MPSPGGEDGDLASSWIELVDDLGATVFIHGVDSPGLRSRVNARGATVVNDIAAAETIITDPSGLHLLASVESSVTVACLAANRWSPLRRRDRSSRGQNRAAASYRRVVAATGVDNSSDGEVFGLLRSLDEPRAAIPMRSSDARSLVLDALVMHMNGPRLGLLRVLRRLGGRGARAYPAWLFIAHGNKRAQGHRVSGQIGHADKADLTRLIGDPPVMIERDGDPARAEREAAVLSQLAATPFAGYVPELITDPGARTDHTGRSDLVMSCLPGATLAPRTLTADELESWTERAAAVLARLHAATGDDTTGTVMVHGDYWLGNVTVVGDEVVGVFDWEDARRGPDTIDSEFLVTSLVDFLGEDQKFAARIEAAVQRGLSSVSESGGVR